MIESPVYSLIQFHHAGEAITKGEGDDCFITQDVCLPVNNLSDLSFQFISDDAHLTIGLSDECKNVVVSIAPIVNPVTLDLGDGTTLYTVNSSDFDVIDLGELYSEGECFYIVLSTDEPKIISCSTCLKYIGDTCFTTVVKYRCNENAFGFRYDDLQDPNTLASFYNKARLSMFKHAPKPQTERTVFKLSDGSIKKLASSTVKQFDVELDYMPESVHYKIVAMFEHDEVYMDSKKVTLQDGNYEIGWFNEPALYTNFAPAKCKVIDESSYISNSNCK